MNVRPEMAVISSVLSIRNIAILAGVFGAVILSQWLLLSHKNNRIDKLKNNVHQLEIAIDAAITANETNQQTIAELRQANQQCAQSRELNEQTAQQELTRQSERIADINRKYDELRKIKVISKCADVVISDDVIKLLQAGSSNKD